MPPPVTLVIHAATVLAKSVPCDDRATLGRKLPKEADAIVTPVDRAGMAKAAAGKALLYGLYYIVDRGAALARRQRADIAGALAEGLGNKAALPPTSPQRDDRDVS